MKAWEESVEVDPHTAHYALLSACITANERGLNVYRDDVRKPQSDDWTPTDTSVFDYVESFCVGSENMHVKFGGQGKYCMREGFPFHMLHIRSGTEYLPYLRHQAQFIHIDSSLDTEYVPFSSTR